MDLPIHVRRCIDRLEAAGFAAYAVGGCVRDACLGLKPHDYDLCTDALPEQVEEVFADHELVLTGKQHGSVAVRTDGDTIEITTFRTEGDYLDNRHPGWVRFVPDINEDLARRDFTVNAIAYSPTRGFADPFGGREDLKKRVLRTCGDPAARFREDSLRILRGIRFAARFSLEVEPDTLDAMIRLAPLMDNLARERVFEELCKLLTQANAQDLIRFAPILAAVIPELEPMIGFDQRSPHHIFDLFTHTAHVTAAVPPQLPLRWAGLLHDTGKIPAFTVDKNGRGHFYGHAAESARIADAVLQRLRAPKALREQTVFLIENHMNLLTPDRKLLRRRISQYGIDNVYQLFRLQQADFSSKGADEADRVSWFYLIDDAIGNIREEDCCLTLKDLALTGRDLMDLGFAPGRGIGECLQHLLDLVLDEAVPNEKEALLNEAEKYKEQGGKPL